jgi:hypothetical protein
MPSAIGADIRIGYGVVRVRFRREYDGYEHSGSCCAKHYPRGEYDAYEHTGNSCAKYYPRVEYDAYEHTGNCAKSYPRVESHGHLVAYPDRRCEGPVCNADVEFDECDIMRRLRRVERIGTNERSAIDGTTQCDGRVSSHL